MQSRELETDQRAKKDKEQENQPRERRREYSRVAFRKVGSINIKRLERRCA